MQYIKKIRGGLLSLILVTTPALTKPVNYSQWPKTPLNITTTFMKRSKDHWLMNITNITLNYDTSRKICPRTGCTLYIYDEKAGPILFLNLISLTQHPSWESASSVAAELHGFSQQFYNPDLGGDYTVHFELNYIGGKETLEIINGKLPPTKNSCNIREKSYVLDHKTLPADNLNGNTTSLTANISCELPASVTITASDNAGLSKINLAPGLGARLKINSRDGADGVQVNNQKEISFTLSSTLENTSAISAGDYKSSGILKIEFQ